MLNQAIAGPLQPDAGVLQQQIKPSAVPAEPSSSSADLPAFSTSEIKDSARFLVKTIRIIGNEAVDALELHQLVKDLVGTETNLADLQKACQRINDYYHARGYGLTRAIVPPQEIEDGRVTLQVIEAKYGTIEIENTSRVRTSLIQATVEGLKQGESIRQYDLEKALLLLTDIPGAQSNTVLKAGKTTSQSDMVVEMTEGPMLSGRLVLDDYGNMFINRLRMLANLNVSNIAGYGDVLSLNYLTTGERMQYARASYDTLINGYGTRIGGAYTYLKYKLGDDLKPLDANGNSDTFEVYVRQPLIRSRINNLYATLQYGDNRLQDRIDSANIRNDRDVRSTTLSFNGDRHDGFLGGGVNSYSVSYTTGQVDFSNAAAALTDALSRDTAGHFSKWIFNFNRLQSINDKTQLWFSYTQQESQNNLDSSQKMTFGGPYSVRAYDNGTVSGDNGSLFSIELRRFLAEFHGKIQAVIFADSAWVEVNENRWAGNTGLNKAQLHGAGVGVQWLGTQNVTAKLSAASTIGSANELTEAGDRKLVWFEVSKYF